MLEEIRITSIQGTGYFHAPIRQSTEQGKVARDSEEIRIQNILDEERKIVQPIYNARGKIIEKEEIGKRIDKLA